MQTAPSGELNNAGITQLRDLPEPVLAMTQPWPSSLSLSGRSLRELAGLGQVWKPMDCPDTGACQPYKTSVQGSRSWERGEFFLRILVFIFCVGCWWLVEWPEKTRAIERRVGVERLRFLIAVESSD